MRVTAVVVSHDGSTYLPRTLAAIQAQTRMPDRVIGVDTDSGDNSLALLSGSLGAQNVLRIEARGGFGAAVRAALAGATARDSTEDTSTETEFLWFLHDDSAPEPTALAELLHAVERAPSVTIAGCKQVDWNDRRSLVDVGLSTSRWGERLTMIDLDEQDQGQYDAKSDVFAVNSAGMLVRRDVWNALGGFDPAFPGTGDDVDLCWRNRLAGHRVVVVPSAVVGHVRDRPDGLGTDSAARKAEIHLRLKHAVWWKVPLLWIGALLGGFYRLFAGLLFKDPGHGGRQFVASLGALARPGAIIRSRRSANRTRRVSRSVIQKLQVDGRDVRSYRRALLEALTGAGEIPDDDLVDAGGEYVPSGDADDDFAAISTSRRLWIGTGAVVAVVLLGAVSLVSMSRLIGAEA
ncbi:MAG: glycosyltransferase, partial [Renibacterium salmoninarum]|nr:glycosyltransferase [Renibacterium salmoninarum]